MQKDVSEFGPECVAGAYYERSVCVNSNDTYSNMSESVLVAAS